MMKRFMNNLFIAIIVLFSSLTYAQTGLLFKITESGDPASIDVILCLDGTGPISCQKYHISAQDFSIITTVNHYYPNAGIKVLTPGYQATGCAPAPNGYCLFAADSQTSTTIQLKGNSPSNYTVGGNISGLVGSVSLQNNGGDTLTQSSDGSFTFNTPTAQGASYNITVSSQPATQTCTVNNGTGTMGNSAVTNVQITCSTNTYSVGGNISGLTGSVSLQNNGGDTLTQNSDGSFTFTTPVAQGAAYNVTVSSQPTTQTCTVNNGTGTMGSSAVTNVQVICSVNAYTVGGTITGLIGSVSLQNNGGDTLTQNSDGSFTFSMPVAEGASYTVTVSLQPATQTCTVSNDSGTMGGAPVTNVQVTCVTNTYSVGGNISGLVGSVSLENNGTDTLIQNSDGSFTFSTLVDQGAVYNVTVSSQPATQTCTVSNGSGTMGGAAVTNVQVTCTTNMYSVGGNISGLIGSVSLVNNGTDTLIQNSDGSFTFPTLVDQGAVYNVTVSSQPATQTCTISNGSGTMGGAPVTNVQVTCTTNTYSVGGTISGLIGSVSLQNNGGDTLIQSGDGSFTFATLVDQGAVYNVTVSSQPATQTCTVSNGSGTMGGANVTNVQVTCATNTYSVGGNISGLVGSVSLQNNGGNTLTQSSDGSFTFTTPVAQGAAYNVTVSSQPATQTCTVSNGTGTMGGADVTNVQVTCSTNRYSVGGTISGLVGSVSLQNNGGDTLTKSSNGSFTFTTLVAQNAAYNVTVSTQPPLQTCTVINGMGTMGSSAVTNVVVSCATNTTTLSVTAMTTIPVGGGSGSITITNTGTTYPATNVSATLPSGWTAVTPSPTSCSSIAPNNGTCTITFTTTKPYVAQSVQITGNNISNTPTTALAFTLQGYYVFEVTSASAAQVYDSADLASSGAQWGDSSIVVAQSLTDGASNTIALVGAFGATSGYAAPLCYQSTRGGASVGTWYLPAICQWGSGQAAACSSGSANIQNLGQLGFVNLNNNNYWSSSGSGMTQAWYQLVHLSSSGYQQATITQFSNVLVIHCAKSVNY